MPKIVDRDKYREELLEKCMKIIIEKGYSNITMREIAKEAGVSTGTLYHYFPTKQSILEKLFTYVRKTNIGDYLGRIKLCRITSEKIDVMSKFLLENEEYYKNILLLAVDLYRHHDSDDTARVFTEFSNDYRNLIAGELDMSAEVGTFFFTYLLGLIFHRILTPDRISYNEQVEIMIGFLKKV